MANEMSQGARGAHGRHRSAASGGQLSATSQLSQSLPVLDVNDVPTHMGMPVITFDHVTKVYAAQPKKPALDNITLEV